MKNKLNIILVILFCVLSLTLFSCGSPSTPSDTTYEVWVFDGEESDFYDVNAGEVFTYESKLKVDYVFDGLYLDEEYKNKYDETKPVNSDLNLYAHYVKSRYTVTFDANGGKGGTSRKVNYNNPCEVPAAKPYKLGGEFLYWCIDKEGANPFDFTTLINEDITLYAKYKEVSYDGIIDQIIPDVIDQNIKFEIPDGGINYMWSSSDETCFTNGGIYLPARTDKEVTITLTITDDGTNSIEYNKKAIVKGYNLKTIEPGHIVAGYVSSWYLGEYVNGFSPEILNTCNVINICFASVTMKGEVDVTSLSSFPKYIAECHKNGIRVLLSVQGSETNDGTKQFAACAKDPTLRVNLAKSMAQAVVKMNLDGIDIDWEYPKGDERYNYTFLMEEIRKELDNLGDDYLLTAAIPGGSWGAGVVEMEKVSKIFDYINMMTYDLEGTGAAKHHTALYPSAAVNEGNSIQEAVEQWHTVHNVPYEKIVIGMAFYGKPALCNSLPNKQVLGNLKTSTSKNVRYSEMHDERFPKLATTSYKYYYEYDEESEAPYIYSYFSETSKTNYFITYDNERSLIAKCEYALEKKLGGVMIWELGEDNTNTLISAVSQGMGKKLDNHDYVITGHQTFKVNQTINVKVVDEILLSSQDFAYYSSDESVAKITDNSVTFIKEGEVIITCKNSNNKIYGKMIVTVTK